MGHPIARTLTLNAAVANGYAQSQSPGGAGALTLNGSLVTGGVGVPNVARRVLLTTVADETARTFTIKGTAAPQPGTTGQLGPAITEALTGVNNTTAYTQQDFATVTSITVDGATTGAVTFGTNGVGSDVWVPWDTTQLNPFAVSVAGIVLSGTPTWQLDVTNDDVYGVWLPSNVPYPRGVAWPSLTGKTGTAGDVINRPVTASRLTLMAAGGVQLTQQQGGN